MTEIPVLDIGELRSRDPVIRARLGRAIQDAFGRCGILHLSGHGVETELIDRLYERFFAFTRRTDSDKRAYCRPDLWFQRGWTPPNTEKAVVARGAADFKECYFACCTKTDPHAVTCYPELYAPNIWPEELPGFREAYEEAATRFQAIGEALLVACERALDLPTLSLVAATRGGAHVTRLLHYLPMDDAAIASKALWGERHTDFNTLTLLPPGRFIDEAGHRREPPVDGAGLYQYTRPDPEHPDGERVSGAPPADCMIAQVGQQLEILTGGHLLATPHEVRAPKSPGIGRLACAHFIHLHPEQRLFPLEAFQTPEALAMYRPPVLAGTYDLKTLCDIGLAPKTALERFGYRNYQRLLLARDDYKRR